jgi:hypothetical protein
MSLSSLFFVDSRLLLLLRLMLEGNFLLLVELGLAPPGRQ